MRKMNKMINKKLKIIFILLYLSIFIGLNVFLGCSASSLIEQGKKSCAYVLTNIKALEQKLDDLKHFDYIELLMKILKQISKERTSKMEDYHGNGSKD